MAGFNRGGHDSLRRISLAVVCVAGLLAGCEESFDGPPEMVPVQLVAGALVPIVDGDTVPLTRPIQGGHVLFVGAYLRNMSSDGASLLGELRRSLDSQGMPLSEPGGVLYSDERSVSVQPWPVGTTPPTAALGWKQVLSDANDTANIPACPNLVDVDIVDNPLYLRVRYEDGKGRSASTVRRITPRCLQTDTAERRLCICECLAGYTIDRCASTPDMGT